MKRLYLSDTYRGKVIFFKDIDEQAAKIADKYKDSTCNYYDVKDLLKEMFPNDNSSLVFFRDYSAFMKRTVARFYVEVVEIAV